MDRNDLINYTPFTPPRQIRLENNTYILCSGYGDVQLIPRLKLRDVWWIPDMRRKLVAQGVLRTKYGVKIQLGDPTLLLDGNGTLLAIAKDINNVDGIQAVIPCKYNPQIDYVISNTPAPAPAPAPAPTPASTSAASPSIQNDQEEKAATL